MENNKELAKALDRTVNYESHIENDETEKLIETINALENLDEVSAALTELSIRNKNAVAPFCFGILENNLGDEFLQAIAFSLLYEVDHGKAMEFVHNNLQSAPAAVLGSLMDNLSTESLQPVGKSLSLEFLKSIADRYLDLSDADKKRITENYEWFLESYGERLL